MTSIEDIQDDLENMAKDIPSDKESSAVHLFLRLYTRNIHLFHLKKCLLYKKNQTIKLTSFNAKKHLASGC